MVFASEINCSAMKSSKLVITYSFDLYSTVFPSVGPPVTAPVGPPVITTGIPSVTAPVITPSGLPD